MALTRLTEAQRMNAAAKFSMAQRIAKRFRPPQGYSSDEWESEVFLVLLEAVAVNGSDDGFEPMFYNRCRWRRFDLIKKSGRQRTLAIHAPVAARPDRPNPLEGVLDNVNPRDSDIIRLRMHGGRWPVIGMAYGVSGRTIQRWHDLALKRIRKVVKA